MTAEASYTPRKPPPPCPVIILTGFLGAGKTTLLNRLLADPALADSAVLINEFGEVGIDHLLVRSVDDGIIMLASGCVCCTVRGDLVNALEDLLRARDNDRIPPFSRVILETTGLADPIPIIQTLFAHPYFAMRFRLAGIITLVDAVNGMATLDSEEAARRQVAVADRLVISKTDLPDANGKTLTARLASLNPLAQQQDMAETDSRILEGLDLWTPTGREKNLSAWLSEELPSDDKAHDHLDGLRSFSIATDQAISLASFEMFVDLLRATHGPKILRFKGLVKVKEHPDQPVVVQGAQNVMGTPYPLVEWPDQNPMTRIVFITRDLQPAIIERLYGAFAGIQAVDQPDTSALMDNPLSFRGP